MNVRRFRALHVAGATYAEIGRECGCDWRTVKKYLAEDAPSAPPAAPGRIGTQPRVITPFVGVIEAWLRADVALKGTVIHERLVAEHAFTGNYQRVKMFLAEARGRIAAELAETDENPLTGLHRRFEVVPGAQAQVDWGDEGDVLGHVGIGNVYSFHMTLSYSRDPFTCFTTSMDLATFWDCHRRAFAHFGGVPGSIVYDRTKTVVRRHVAPGVAVPLHPEAAAFAEHYGFTIDVLAAYRPTGKGRVERQVVIVRDHVLAGRCFDSIAELDGAFAGWLPIRRAQVHRTHGQVIAVRAETDRAALQPLPEQPYLVADKHLRRVGKDCLVSFEASFYSVPARHVRPGQRVQLQTDGGSDGGAVTIHALSTDGGGWLATHPRASVRGSWTIDPAHYDGLPDGHTRAVTLDPPSGFADPTADTTSVPRRPGVSGEPSPLAALLTAHHAAAAPVARRPLTDYQAAALARPIHYPN
ncbi:IS21 family transposase [Kribbella solani]|uniref:IS21 family transposase n=1 Tax=Kribbella solani TaxID=236067 RepID=UPI0029A8E6FE|nr:IS21 family transposase [Kribbella solani]MDX2974569.1 IS21 family transposase [Kribbella solani]MDX3003229.1 IS21 family transposase [Kribbella solani]